VKKIYCSTSGVAVSDATQCATDIFTVSRCQFHRCFTCTFFIRKNLRSFFLLAFGTNFSYKKHVHKTLMKLSPAPPTPSPFFAELLPTITVSHKAVLPHTAQTFCFSFNHNGFLKSVEFLLKCNPGL
jgi:hypothetical protein